MGFTKPTRTQLAVAVSMANVAEKNPIDFVINVGDNVKFSHKQLKTKIIGLLERSR